MVRGEHNGVDDPGDTAAEDSRHLQRLIVRGVTWKGLSQLAIQLTRMAVAVAVARILAPEEYGLAGMALVFAGFVLIFSDLALGQVLVQRRTLTQADKATAFWTSLCAGLTFTGLGVAASGPIADFFGEPRLEAMVAALSVTFFISSVGATQSALLVREMDFRTLELRELVGTAVGSAVAIGAALAGLGAWAIVAGQLATTATTTTLVWAYSPWRPSLVYSWESLRRFAGFSANVLGTQLLVQLRTATPNVVIGRSLGAAALGTYVLAYNIILVPFNRIAVPVAQVMFPAMSRLQDERRVLAAYWRRSLRLLAAVVTPALVGLILVAPEFVEAALGPDWQDATPVIRLLALVGLLQTLQVLNPVVLQALDRTGLLLRWSLLSFAAAVAGLVIGLQWGIVGVAAGFAAAAALTEPTYAWLTARLLAVPLRSLLRDLAGVVQAIAAMTAAVALCRLSLTDVSLPPVVRLLTLVAVGTAVYLPCLAWRAPDVLRDVRRVRRSSGAARPGPAESAAPLA